MRWGLRDKQMEEWVNRIRAEQAEAIARGEVHECAVREAEAVPWRSG
jgi:hypothetical protein